MLIGRLRTNISNFVALPFLKEIPIILGLMIAAHLIGAYASEERFLVITDEGGYPFDVRTGENALINGTAISLISKDMRVSLMLRSNGTEGEDWKLTDIKPSPIFIVPANGEIQYQYEVKFLKTGRFFMNSEATILEIPGSTGGLPISYQSHGSTISVVGSKVFPSNQSILIYVSMAVAIGLSATLFLIYKNKSRKKLQ